MCFIVGWKYENCKVTQKNPAKTLTEIDLYLEINYISITYIS